MKIDYHYDLDRKKHYSSAGKISGISGLKKGEHKIKYAGEEIEVLDSEQPDKIDDPMKGVIRQLALPEEILLAKLQREAAKNEKDARIWQNTILLPRKILCGCRMLAMKLLKSDATKKLVKKTVKS